MKNILKHIMLASGLFAAAGCTDLTENIYSDNTTGNFYNNETEVLSAVLRPYTHSRAVFACQSRENYWRMNELSADQLAWPVKGPHGYDDGKWIQLHYHTWTNMHKTVEDSWNLFFMGLGLVNDAIENLEERSASSMQITEEQRAAFIAELRANRAYYYMGLMDLWGNVPISTKVGEPEMPETSSRAEIFNFVETEMLAVIDDLPELSRSEHNSGRFTKAAGYAMLATLYLNAEVWTGEERWDDCITYCDKLIEERDGVNADYQFDLDEDILTPFCKDNSDESRENILVLTYDYMASGMGCGWSGDFYHFQQKYISGGTANGNDGVVVVPSAYDAFADNDLRKQEWMLIGPQYRYDEPSEPVVGTSEYSGLPLVFVKDIKRISSLGYHWNELGQVVDSDGNIVDNATFESAVAGLKSTMETGEENSGARFNKYRTGAQTDDNYWGNDWVLYRLTEIYFIKAEALMRKNGGQPDNEGVAVDLINTCIERAFTPKDWAANVNNCKYTQQTLTLDALLEERGREFIFEGKRRTDLIRFGKFTSGTWWDHTASNDENKELFPIPYAQTSLNSNLEQNPGY